MHRAAGVFLTAVFAAILIGTAPAGAADEPVATAPIPPAEPPRPATPMMLPATPTPTRNSPMPKSDAPSPAAGLPKPKQATAAGAKPKHERRSDAAEHGRRSKGPVARHTETRKNPRRKLAAEKAGAAKTAAEEAAVAAAAEAAERDTARRRAAELGREGYQDATRARPRTLPAPPGWAPPANDDMTYGNEIFSGRSYNGGTYPDGGPPRPDAIDGGRSRYHAEYPAPPMLYGPAYPPPWYNGPRPESYPARSYPDRWGRGPMAPW
jgi:hypothetical protein